MSFRPVGYQSKALKKREGGMTNRRGRSKRKRSKNGKGISRRWKTIPEGKG